MHPTVNGNKWFKLKKNLAKAVSLGHKTILTFGGAASNHIAATAAACEVAGLGSVGIIRGEAVTGTLTEAKKRGMQVHFVNREEYKHKDDISFVNGLKEQYGDFYLVPEGGNNEEGIMGCRDIADPEWKYDHLFCACGTGATFAGLVATPGLSGVVTGISILKGTNSMPVDVQGKLENIFPAQKRLLIKGNEVLLNKTITSHSIINHWAFDGYAKFHPELASFKQRFENDFAIPLDHVYTVKLFYAVNQLLSQRKIEKGKTLLVIHSGGLQGDSAFEERYQRKLSR
jgi:1-aminocyclopropane-1-carboxylate deaminase/D-cysteine desulfhydrase-like pyridoxal-dependent ACC family enzyme